MTTREKELLLAIFDAYVAAVEYASHLHAILYELDPEWIEEFVKLKQIADQRGLSVERVAALELDQFRQCIQRNKIPEARSWFEMLSKLFSERPSGG